MLPTEITTDILCHFKVGQRQITRIVGLILKGDRPFLVLNLQNEAEDLEIQPEHIEKNKAGSNPPYNYLGRIEIQSG